ncbi:MAG TPA: hypothetical protein VM686_42955 [Polyangiaceae bacterium]|jgi:hypothetical protein|nr:hypothetical protein [Polyangiaceae bacterium]
MMGPAVVVSSRQLPAFDGVEILLWSTLRLFEEQALRHYRHWAVHFADDAKRSHVAMVQSAAPSWEAFEQSTLQRPMRELLDASESIADERQLLIVQGLVYERVRDVIYRTIESSQGASLPTRQIAGAGRAVSAEIARRSLELLRAGLDASGPLFGPFVEHSDEVLHKLDAVGECVDEMFGERFGLRFSDVVGEFVADLVPACVELGMDRRKVMGHLAGALMGL